MKRQRINQYFLAMSLCCMSGSVFAQSTQTDKKPMQKQESDKGKKKAKSKFSDDPIELNNVVVTALGIKREETLRLPCQPTGHKPCKVKLLV